MRNLALACFASLLVLLVPKNARAEDHRWSGATNYSFSRNRTNLYENSFHDRLSLTAAAFRTLSATYSMGVEVGYHGTNTVRGVQCGSEWAVDCPSPGTVYEAAWESAVLARVKGKWGGFRPYAVAGVGPYLTGNFVIESRQATIRRHVEPGLTAGLGIQRGVLGIEGRWHYIANGAADSRYRYLEDRFEYSYSPLRLYSASVGIHFP